MGAIAKRTATRSAGRCASDAKGPPPGAKWDGSLEVRAGATTHLDEGRVLMDPPHGLLRDGVANRADADTRKGGL